MAARKILRAKHSLLAGFCFGRQYLHLGSLPDDATSAGRVNRRARVGRFHEWHLVLANPFQYGEFSLVPGQFELGVSLRPSLAVSRLESVRSIGNAMKCDGVE